VKRFLKVFAHGNMAWLHVVRAVMRQSDDSDVIRTKHGKGLWIGRELGVLDYQNSLHIGFRADLFSINSQPTAEVSGECREEMGPVHHPERDSRMNAFCPATTRQHQRMRDNNQW
jgi:hypothetical protein